MQPLPSGSLPLTLWFVVCGLAWGSLCTANLATGERTIVIAMCAAVMPVGLRYLRRRLWLAVQPALLSPTAVATFASMERWPWLAFGIALTAILGVRLSLPTVEATLLLFAGSYGGAVVFALTRAARHEPHIEQTATQLVLSALFLLSGMAALIYEVVWQRVLYSLYGIHIESVTLIVALFMLGLGLGALLGGRLSVRATARLPLWFAGIEAAIGLFGLVSITLMEAVAAHTQGGDPLTIGIATALLLGLPTLCMGATLPILVEHLHRTVRNVGAAMGRLYFFNTVGAALASLITVDLLFVLTGRQGAARVAAMLNFGVAGVALLVARRHKQGESAPQQDHQPALRPPAPRPNETIPQWLAFLLAGLVGFVSLSQEILWMRPLAWATQGAPQVFGHVLALFLAGIAGASWQAKRLCEQGIHAPKLLIAKRLLLSAAVFWLAVPLMARATAWSTGVGIAVGYLAVIAVAATTGAILPLVVHCCAAGRHNAGQQVARIYLCNIIGATAGPLFTAFVLLDAWPLQSTILGLTLALTLAGVALAAADLSLTPARWAVTLGAVGALAAVGLHPWAYERIFERMVTGSQRQPDQPFIHLFEGRSGVIGVRQDNVNGDVVFGGGAYDGRIRIDPVHDTNGLHRALIATTLHRNPERVLEIGLASGAWARVVLSHPAVRSFDAIEINPSYTRLVAAYPQVAPVLSDPRVQLHVDDGRRWLVQHPDARFDLVVMNTTFHWRSNATSLLSREFMALVRSRLLPGGVFYFNSTWAPDVPRTAAAEFAHVVRYGSFVAASDAPIGLPDADRRRILASLLLDGRPLVDPAVPAQAAVLARLATVPLVDIAEQVRRDPTQQVITDDNMRSEFKRPAPGEALAILYRWLDPAVSSFGN
ncbi:MAG: spermidine synthase [Myxococcales bacterium]|nr:spermidine synthase [Myxococcales bacterium]